MGTNYYWIEESCPHCGRGSERLHIGKSSAGWCFALHVMPEEGINSLEDWKERWNVPGSLIEDEYGAHITKTDLLSTITEREWRRAEPRSASYLATNDAEDGPKGLMRHRIGRHCVGHGDGTWDLMPGNFS